MGRSDNNQWSWAAAELLFRWAPSLKSQLTGADPDTGKPWGQEEKEVTAE